MKNTVSERLLLIQQKLGITKLKIGELAGSKTPSQSVNNWIKRDSISKSAAEQLSAATGFSVSWILTGIGDQEMLNSNIRETRLTAAEWESLENKHGEFIEVPVLDVELSAGYGSFNEAETEKYTLPFRAYTLKQRGISYDKVRIVRVLGDSMEPKLSDDDTIAINMADTRIRDGKIYAVRVYDSQKVKMLIKNADGTITMRSLNPAYADEVISREQMESEEFKVLGRMWWHSSIDD